MKCSEIQKMLPEYAARKLSGYLLEEVDRHVQSCKRCRDWLENHQNVVELLLADPAPVRSDQDWLYLEKKIVDLVHDRRQVQSFRTRLSNALADLVLFHPGQLRYGSAFAAVILVLAVAAFFGLRSPVQELTPRYAAKICDDPEVWNGVIWTTDSETTALYSEPLGEDESLQEYIYTTIFSDEDTNSFEIITAEEQELDIWSLIDKLNEDGIQLLKRELKKDDRV